MSNLLDLLLQEEPIANIENDDFTSQIQDLQITDYALEKAYAYARLTCKEFHTRQIECGGYLIAKKGAQGRVATDAYLAKNQIVGSGEYLVKPIDVIKAGREIDQLGYRVLGWWHSHGNLPTFFSQVDDIGQLTILNEIAGVNFIEKRVETSLRERLVSSIEGNTLTLYDDKRPSRKYELDMERIKGELLDFRIVDTKKIGFAYGLVVNAKSVKKPYAEVAVRDFCGYCRDAEDVSYEVPVNVTQAIGKKIYKDQLKKEIKERVRRRPVFFQRPQPIRQQNRTSDNKVMDDFFGINQDNKVINPNKRDDANIDNVGSHNNLNNKSYVNNNNNNNVNDNGKIGDDNEISLQDIEIDLTNSDQRYQNSRWDEDDEKKKDTSIFSWLGFDNQKRNREKPTNPSLIDTQPQLEKILNPKDNEDTIKDTQSKTNEKEEKEKPYLIRVLDDIFKN